MNVTILGYGHIGGTIGKKWAQAGHTIHYGVRDPAKPEVQELVRSIGKNASVTGFAEAIALGEVVLFAIPGRAMSETTTANARTLDGKILIDAANNLGAQVANSFATFASQTPNAPVYRAFNTYGWEIFENARFGNTTADMFYCGTDGEARLIVENLIKQVGVNPIYVGGPDQVELVDSVLRLWFTLVRGQNMGRGIAFKVITR